MRFSYVLAQSSPLFREGGTLFVTISYNEMTFFFFHYYFHFEPQGCRKEGSKADQYSIKSEGLDYGASLDK